MAQPRFFRSKPYETNNNKTFINSKAAIQRRHPKVPRLLTDNMVCQIQQATVRSNSITKGANMILQRNTISNKP